jgi:hypothetical protein
LFVAEEKKHLKSIIGEEDFGERVLGELVGFCFVFCLSLDAGRRRRRRRRRRLWVVSGCGWFSLRAQILVWWSGKKLNGGVELHLTPDGG